MCLELNVIAQGSIFSSFNLIFDKYSIYCVYNWINAP